MVAFIAFTSGLLFALGLGIAGMTLPGRVTAFLDFTGDWNGSLMFVMVGAILVYSVGYRLICRRSRPILDETFHIPGRKNIDRSLIWGAIVFGVGWGLAGFCPGPALASVATLGREPLIFVSALLFAMFVFEMAQRRRKET